MNVRVQVIGEDRHLATAVGLAAFRVVVEASRMHTVTAAPRRWRWWSPSCRAGFRSSSRTVGRGFDVSATEARLGRTRSLGLISMRERVENVGGSFEIRSAPGAGTEVRAIFFRTS